ncbi:MAG: ChaB family protein [Chroococcidiopsidaceae cyanobacterium CP_BM_ER_R8_30]|nr:ChaB family protein [Chroococcidiopsidaceae cyanobacterium CP_BM_ER_R8_30]
MSEQQLNDLPSEVKDKLPSEAQQVFQAAFKSAKEDGVNEEAALQIGWNTVKQKYVQGEDGSWHRKPEDTNIHIKSVQSGGN